MLWGDNSWVFVGSDVLHPRSIGQLEGLRLLLLSRLKPRRSIHLEGARPVTSQATEPVRNHRQDSGKGSEISNVQVYKSRIGWYPSKISDSTTLKRQTKIKSCQDITCFSFIFTTIRHCLVVRIPGSHPGGPGSIPGVGKSTFCQCFESLKVTISVTFIVDFRKRFSGHPALSSG